MSKNIETERLNLCVEGPADASALLDYLRQNKAHLEPWDPPHPEGYYTLEFWNKQLVHSQRGAEEGRSARFLMRLKDNPQGPVIGRCNYSNIVRGSFRSAFLGYSIDRRYEGMGYMTEALDGSLDHIFNVLELHRVQANYIPTNGRSAKVLRRLGFTVEGYARDYLYINGAWRDHIMAALLNPAPIEPC